jgi:hypothetical protein
MNVGLMEKLTSLVVVGLAVMALPLRTFAQIQPLPPSPLCIDDDTKCAAGQSGIKWHPGHYALTQTRGYIPASVIADISALSSVRGIEQRYNWSTLEPSRGKYDFSAIRSDLERLRPYGKRLIVLLMDRTWAGTDTSALPAYLATEPNSNNGIVVKPDNEGVIARIWNEAVMDRLIALSEAMAAEFDNEPLFEGIRFEEITPSMSPGGAGVPADYNVAAMTTQWKRLATSSRQHWQRTNVFFNTNTLGGVTGPLQIIEHGYQIGGLGVGAPDVIPPGASDYQMAGERVVTRSPDISRGDNPDKFIRDYRGKLPIMHSVQTPSLGGKEGTFKPVELADYIILQVGATHLSWVVAPSNVPINWADYIRPYLAASPRSTVQACPATYTVGCDTR